MISSICWRLFGSVMLLDGLGDYWCHVVMLLFLMRAMTVDSICWRLFGSVMLMALFCLRFGVLPEIVIVWVWWM